MDGYIYFLRFGRIIKVGKSNSSGMPGLIARLKNHAKEHPEAKLLALMRLNADCTDQVEAVLHIAFNDSRVNGEKYRRTPMLNRLMRSVRAVYEAGSIGTYPMQRVLMERVAQRGDRGIPILECIASLIDAQNALACEAA